MDLLQNVIWILAVIIGIVDFIFYSKFCGYIKKRYPKIYQEVNLKYILTEWDSNLYLLKETWVNSHPNDKKYSLFLYIMRVNEIVIAILILIWIKLIFFI